MEATIKILFGDEYPIIQTKRIGEINDFLSACHKRYDFANCIDMLQDFDFCARYCEHVANIRGGWSGTFQDLLIFDKSFFVNSFPLEWYYYRAANFFAFKFVSKDLPISYQNSFYDCVWRVPKVNPLENIDNPNINGNAYMIDPKQEKPLHYYLNEWAKCLKNKSHPKF